jgi:hypothetical protein
VNRGLPDGAGVPGRQEAGWTAGRAVPEPAVQVTRLVKRYAAEPARDQHRLAPGDDPV